MNHYYLSVFVVLLIVSALSGGYLYVRSGTTDRINDQGIRFRQFQKKFLRVYFLATFADWIQGPYFYKLFTQKQLDPNSIGTLFVTGYLSSMCLSPMIGLIVDRYGRKRGMMMFGLLYSCT